MDCDYDIMLIAGKDMVIHITGVAEEIIQSFWCCEQLCFIIPEEQYHCKVKLFCFTLWNYQLSWMTQEIIYFHNILYDNIVYFAYV